MFKKQSVDASQDLITDEKFKSRHRKNAKAFVRERKLTFPIIIVPAIPGEILFSTLL
jgi:hypothetical protein